MKHFKTKTSFIGYQLAVLKNHKKTVLILATVIYSIHQNVYCACSVKL